MKTPFKDKYGNFIQTNDVVLVENTDPDDLENSEDVMTICKKIKSGFTLKDSFGGRWTRQLYYQPERLTVLGQLKFLTEVFENLESAK